MGKGELGGRNCTDNGQVNEQGYPAKSVDLQSQSQRSNECSWAGKEHDQGGTSEKLVAALCKMEKFPKGVERPLWDPEHEEMKLEIAGKSELSCRR